MPETQDKTTPTISESALIGFIGTAMEDRVQHPVFKRYLMTEGVQYLRTHGCDWLVTAMIAGSHFKNLGSKCEGHQFWRLKVDLAKKTAVLTCDDGGIDGKPKVHYRQKIEYTDCPVAELVVYIIDEGDYKIVLLSGEY